MKFNYCIGYYYDDSGKIEVYRHIMGREVFYGDTQQAESFLEDVKNSSPYHDWQLFKIGV